jgi:small acid-soluble spore protein D (minor alpha/beta-type SASP)
MSRRNKILNPNARGAMDRLKMETANEVGVKLNAGYNGDIKSKDAGTVGGNMVKKMIEDYEAKAESAGVATAENKYNSSSNS